MHEPRLMGVGQRLGDLDDDLQRFLLAVPVAFLQAIVHRSPLHIFHHEIMPAVGLADVIGPLRYWGD